MEAMTQYLVVGAVGSVGAMLRLLVGRLCVQCLGASFPLATLIINVTGMRTVGLVRHGDSNALEPWRYGAAGRDRRPDRFVYDVFDLCLRIELR